jgi:hypothetical protein
VSTFLRWAPAVIAGAALLAVAAVAGIVSYTHIDALTLALGGSRMVGHLMPFGVDGQMVVGSVVLMTASGPAARWGWLGIGLGMAESLFANFESGIAHGLLAAAWYAVPAMSFAVATFTFERWAKSQVTRVAAGGLETTFSAPPATEGESPSHSHPQPSAPLSTEAALQALLATDSERKLAGALGVDRNRVQTWKRQLAEVTEGGSPEPVNGSVPEPSLNGSHPTEGSNN